MYRRLSSSDSPSEAVLDMVRERYATSGSWWSHLEPSEDDREHSLLQLPTEVVDRIGGFLDDASLMRLSQTCRRLHAIVQRPETYRRLVSNLHTDPKDTHDMRVRLDEYDHEVWDARRDLLVRVLRIQRHGGVAEEDPEVVEQQQPGAPVPPLPSHVHLLPEEERECNRMGFLNERKDTQEAQLKAMEAGDHDVRFRYISLFLHYKSIRMELDDTALRLQDPREQQRIAWDHLTLWSRWRLAQLLFAFLVVLLGPVNYVLFLIHLYDATVPIVASVLTVLVLAYIALAGLCFWMISSRTIFRGFSFGVVWGLGSAVAFMSVNFIVLGFSTSIDLPMFIIARICVALSILFVLLRSFIAMVFALITRRGPWFEIDPSLVLWCATRFTNLLLELADVDAILSAIPILIAIPSVPILAYVRTRMASKALRTAILAYLLPADVAFALHTVTRFWNTSVILTTLPLLVTVAHHTHLMFNVVTLQWINQMHHRNRHRMAWRSPRWADLSAVFCALA